MGLLVHAVSNEHAESVAGALVALRTAGRASMTRSVMAARSAAVAGRAMAEGRAVVVDELPAAAPKG
jgi:hypothetical protein